LTGAPSTSPRQRRPTNRRCRDARYIPTVLMSVLPGLRDLRAPLVTGAAWGATMWLLVWGSAYDALVTNRTGALQALLDFLGHTG